MTSFTSRSVLAAAVFALAFLIASPSASAFTYNNPPTATNAVTTAGYKCTGPTIASLGGSGGTGAVPVWATLAWAYLNAASLPADYNNGNYCIDALKTVTIEDGGGDGGGQEAAAILAIGGGGGGGTTSWTVDYLLHSSAATTPYSGGMYHSLTYTAGVTATLSASPASVNSGNSSLLTWSSTGATSCTGTNFSTGNATSGSLSVTPSSTTNYSVTCTGPGGSASQSRTVTVVAVAPPSITSFSVTPSSSASGAAVTISWNSANADYCSSAQFDTEGATSGTKTVNPTTSTTYTLSCTGATGTGTGTWQYHESDLTDLSCPWTDTGRPYGGMPTCQQTPLTGSSCTNPPDRRCKVNSSGGGNGNTCVVATDIYTCTISGPPPTVSESRAVTVAQPAVTASLSANPSSVVNGNTSVLTWSSTGAETCMGTGGDFATGGATSGSATVQPSATTQYSITCYAANYSSGGTAIATGEWWTGTQTQTFNDYVASTGQEGGICANTSSTGVWNASIATTEAGGGDNNPGHGEDEARVTCWDITNPTGTVDKPYQVTSRPSGACRGSICTTETGYFRSNGSSGGTGGTAAAQTTVTVTTTQCSDGISNDSDGLIDMADSGCTYPGDDTEDPNAVTATLTNNGPIRSGQSATLTWGSTGASSCTGTGFSTGGATSGSVSTGVLTSPPIGYPYSVSCSGAVANTTVSLSNPIAYIMATPDRVNSGATTLLSFSAANLTPSGTCSVTGPSGTLWTGASSGAGILATTTSTSPAITKQSTFVISCDGASNLDNVIVNLVPRFEEF